MGAAAVLFILALEHRLPSVFTIMQWMDHGTLALLWGMMIIVALLAKWLASLSAAPLNSSRHRG